MNRAEVVKQGDQGTEPRWTDLFRLRDGYRGVLFQTERADVRLRMFGCVFLQKLVFVPMEVVSFGKHSHVYTVQNNCHPWQGQSLVKPSPAGCPCLTMFFDKYPS